MRKKIAAEISPEKRLEFMLDLLIKEKTEGSLFGGLKRDRKDGRVLIWKILEGYTLGNKEAIYTVKCGNHKLLLIEDSFSPWDPIAQITDINKKAIFAKYFKIVDTVSYTGLQIFKPSDLTNSATLLSAINKKGGQHGCSRKRSLQCFF